MDSIIVYEIEMQEENNLEIKTIQQIPQDKYADVLDKEAIELLFKKAQAEGLIFEGKKPHYNIDGITINKNGIGGSINTF